MRARSHNSRVLLGNRPYSGSLGASLYVGTPAATDIRYRRGKCVQPGSLWYPVSETGTINPGDTVVKKTLAVAQVTSPTAEIDYTLPAALQTATIACQVRTYAADYENETIYRPILIKSSGGEELDAILGSATVLAKDKLDGGGMRLRFAYVASRSGTQPTQYALVQTSGAPALSDVVITADGRIHEIDVTGMTDAVAYGWNLEARAGAVTAVLAAITFTADAAGPPVVTGAVAVEM